MRVLVPVFVIAIIAVTTLLIIRSVNRTAQLKKDLSNATLELNDNKALINRIYAELNMQISTNYFDPQPLQDMLNSRLRKDITTT